MIKNLTLFSLIFIFVIQTSFGQGSRPEDQLFLPQNSQAKLKQKKKQAKSAGTILYQEDFNGSLNGWTSQSNSSPSHQWIWSTTAPGGQYSTHVNVIASPSAANGFLVLPSDQYNSPTPSNGFANVNASISSPAISITPKPSVHLSFYQSQRYYGANPNAMYVEVSADSVNWTVFPTTNYRSSEASSLDGEYMKINVTQVLANSSTAYLRFVQTGASHYYWMIDDVKLIEGPRNQLEISKKRIVQLDTFGIDPVVSAIPQAFTCKPLLKFFIENTGAYPLTNNRCKLNVYQDSSLNGGPGFGIVFQDSFNLQYLINPGQQLDVRILTNYLPIQSGYYSYELDCKSDSVFDQALIVEFPLTITDSVLSKVKPSAQLNESFSSSYIQGGGNDSDFVGTIFNGAFNTISSLSFYVGNDQRNIGVQIVPQVYSYEKDSATLSGSLNTLIAENLVPTTISTNMLDSWITLDFSFGTGPQYLQANKLYVAGCRILSKPMGNNLFVGRLIEEERENIQSQSFAFINSSNPHWISISMIPAITMNYPRYASGGGPCGTVGFETLSKREEGIKLNVYPNPSSGLFTIETNASFQNAEVQVFDLLGKQVYRAMNLSQNSQNWSLDLQHLKQGVYLLQLNQEGRRETHKIMIKH